MRLIYAVIALFASISFAHAQERQEKPKCPTCETVTVELKTTREMLAFISSTQPTDPQYKKVLDTLVTWVLAVKDYNTANNLISPGYARQGLEKEGRDKLRTMLVTADSPSVLITVLQSFRNELTLSAAERELICAKILKGTEVEAIRAFDSGCIFGHYADALRARLLVSRNQDVARLLDHSPFTRAFLSDEERRAIRARTGISRE